MIAEDSGWLLLEDRPRDYFCRFVDAEEKSERVFTCDVYYSKKGSVRLKQCKGNNYFFHIGTANDMEEVFTKPYSYYKAAHTVLKRSS